MWTTAGGGEDDEARRHNQMVWRRRQRPENEVPGSVAIDAVLVGNDECVVFISGVRAFSNGVEFSLEVRAWHTSTDERGDMFVLHGHDGPGDPHCLVSSSPTLAGAPTWTRSTSTTVALRNDRC